MDKVKHFGPEDVVRARISRRLDDGDPETGMWTILFMHIDFTGPTSNQAETTPTSFPCFLLGCTLDDEGSQD